MSMSSSTAGLLTIGEFSRLSWLSIRMLRHYDANALLAPEFVDPLTGYRYYGSSQLEAAGRIRALRDIGCSVAQIGRLLPLFGSPSELSRELAAQRERLEGEARRIDTQLRDVDRLVAYLTETTMSIEVRRIHLPEMYVATVRDRVPTYADEKMLWDRMAPLHQTDAACADDAISGATFYDPDYRDNEVDIEVWIQVSAPFTPRPPLACRAEPAREIVCATLLGDYAQMGSVTAAIGTYLAEHDLATGPMFNIYRVSPAQNPDPAAWVTDVCFPLLGSEPR